MLNKIESLKKEIQHDLSAPIAALEIIMHSKTVTNEASQIIKDVVERIKKISIKYANYE